MDTRALMVQSPDMSEHERGRQKRDQIMEELARRWEEFDPTPTEEELAATLRMGRISIRFHAAKLREREWIHPTALWITPAGYRETRGRDPLTN